MQKHFYGLLFCLFFLNPLHSQTQTEKEDTIAHPKKPVFSTIIDGIATGVRETGRAVRRKGKEFNDVDTLFIEPNKYNLAFMLEHSSWYEHFSLKGIQNDKTQRINFAPNANFKLGIYFGWRWIFLGYTFDAANLFGKEKEKTKKKEMGLNIYSSKFGVDLYWRKTGSDFKIRSYSGFDLPPTTYKDVDFAGIESKIVGFNTYWIFNHKHFSYPAVYSQSTNQRRSAGSWMSGLSYSHQSILFNWHDLPWEIGKHLYPHLRFSRIKYSDFSINVGYGYNWVFAKNCVANLSLLPAIGYKASKIESEYNNAQKDPDEHWIEDINFDLITRAGIVYNNSKYFVGASVVINTYRYSKNNFTLTNSFGTLRVYAGLNFWKRKSHKRK